MKRRLNSTGRRRISRALFTIRLLEDPESGERRFEVDLTDLRSLDVDGAARVIIEPYVKQSSMRFDLGPIRDLPDQISESLSEIDRGAAIQFRLRVVDTREAPGRILAAAEQVRPTDPDIDDDRRSILPMRETDLGEAVWRIDVGADTAPCLLINNRIPGMRQRLEEDVLLQGAIYTYAAATVMRVVLSENVDDEADWVKDWREFAEDLVGEELPESAPEDIVDELIERITEAFDQRQQWRSIAVTRSSVEGVEYE
jgi:hypothetical protein